MKRIILGLGIALMANVGLAQKNVVSSAGLAYKDYDNSFRSQDMENSVKYIKEAKEFIDKALQHPDSKDEAKCLMYAGKIYIGSAMMYGVDSTAFSGMDVEKTMENGFAYLKRSKEVDSKGKYEDDVNDFANYWRAMLSNQGINAYTDEKYDVAMGALLGAAMFGDVAGVVDSSFYFFGGQAAIVEKEYEEAAKAFKKCVDVNYNVAQSAGFLGEALTNLGKKEEAEKELKAVVEKHPKNLDVLIQLTNFYINEKRNEDAGKVISEAIKLDPSNVALVYTSGIIYENMGNLDDAEAAYKKTIELDAKNTDAMYSLGVFFFNKGADANNEANEYSISDPQYEILIAKKAEYFKSSVEWLEKANTTKPNDLSILEALKSAYGKAGDVENFKKIKAQIAQLQG